jgi:hypothetical protein
MSKRNPLPLGSPPQEVSSGDLTTTDQTGIANFLLDLGQFQRRRIALLTHRSSHAVTLSAREESPWTETWT